MPRRPSGKTKSELVLEYQGRIRAKGLARVMVWVPESRREDMLKYASRLRHQDGVLLPFEEKRRQRIEQAAGELEEQPETPSGSAKKLSRKQRKRQARLTTAKTTPALPLMHEAGMLPGFPGGAG